MEFWALGWHYVFLSMALVWHYVALRFALNRRARFRSPRGGLLEQAGGPTWPNRGGLLGQVGGCRGPSLTFGWVERLFTRPRLGGSQVLHSPLGGLKGYSLIPGCEFKSLSFSPGESQVLHSPWVGYKVHSPHGALYCDFRLWRGQKHRRSLFSTASGLN